MDDVLLFAVLLERALDGHLNGPFRAESRE